MQRIKKVMAGVGSVLMTGATLASPVFAGKSIGEAFSEMTPANTVVVVGENAAVSDVVAAIAIAAKLGQHGATASVSGGTAVTEVSGGVSLDDVSDKLYMGDAINKVKDTLTEKELPEVLADGLLEDDEGTTYEYSQYVEIGSNTIVFDQMETDEDPVVAIQLSTTSASPLYTYRVDFNKVVNFTKKDADGRNVMAGNSLTLGGVEFTISPDSTATKLVLYKASESVTLGMGEEKTVYVEGNEYTIKVIGFDTDKDEVILEVNGATDSVKEGRSRTIGGLEIYAKSVTAWNNGQEGIAVLQVGSEKITLVNGEEVMVGENEDPIDGTEVVFVGTDSNGNGGVVDELAGIKIKVYAPDTDRDYIPAGGEFEDPVFKTFKVKFTGLVPDLKDESRDVIEIKNSGDDKGYVKFRDIGGEERTLYWVYDGASAGDLKLRGSGSTENIYVVEGETVQEDEITFLAPGNERYTHLVKVVRIYSDDAQGYVEFEDVITGEKYKTKEDVFRDAGDTLDLIVDGKTYVVRAMDGGADSSDATPVTQISVEYVDGKTVVYPTIELNNGEKLAITDVQTLGDSITTDGSSITYILPTGELTVTADLANNKAVITTSSGDSAEVVLSTADSSITNTVTVSAGSVSYDVSVTVSDTDSDTVLNADQIDVNTVSINGVTTPALLIIEEEDDDGVENAIIVAEDGADTGSDDYVSFNAPVFTGTKWEASTSDSDVKAYVDYYGVYAEYDTSDSNHDVVTIWYPNTQMYALVAVGEDPEYGAVVSGGSANIKFVPVTANMAKLDSEVYSGDKSNYNLILVGGPAINSLVAELADAGKTVTLDEWRSEYINKAIVQVVEDAFASGKVALVVAGYEARDTRNAAAKLLSGELDSYEAAVISGDTVEEME